MGQLTVISLKDLVIGMSSMGTVHQKRADSACDFTKIFGDKEGLTLGFSCSEGVGLPKRSRMHAF